jgi:hypothetical protein
MTNPTTASDFRWRDLLGGSTAAVAMAYALAYSAHLGFWGAFGLTPAEVGISGSELLGRLTIGAAWILLVGGGFSIVVGSFIYWGVKKIAKIAPFASHIAISVTLALGYLLLWWRSGVPFSLGSRIAVAAGVAWVCLVPLVTSRRVTRQTATGQRTGPILSASARRAVLVVGLAGLTAVLTNLWMFGVGDELARGTHSPVHRGRRRQSTVRHRCVVRSGQDSRHVPDGYGDYDALPVIAVRVLASLAIPRADGQSRGALGLQESRHVLRGRRRRAR